MINRTLESKIENRFGTGKAILLIGPRQVGKTTLFNRLLEGKEYLFLNGDDPTVRKLLSNPNLEQLKNIIGNYKTVYIDEAQRIDNIGLTLKLIKDQLKSVQLLVSGSSALIKLRSLLQAENGNISCILFLGENLNQTWAFLKLSNN
ncbi:AAA family ATPase [Salegentibacter mishustinae]|uniref:AAA family ATPase n=1 Tax=Salegentibacter mishustinae TaxID=270918 RepID=UPI002492E90B|nr:AAA family ATPase [Salegentibacter mishustinae]